MHQTTLTLNICLHPGDIPNFRTTIIELVGLEHDIFHNHDGAKHFHWGYPLIQYSVRRGQATITGLQAGAKAIQQVLLPKLMGELHFSGRSYPLSHFELQNRQWDIQTLSFPKLYGMTDWLALNNDNYRQWKATDNLYDRIEILSRAFTGQLRAAGEGLGIPDYKNWEGRVLRVDNQKRIEWHGVQLVRFDALVQANVSLPAGMGLGRSAAFGFGELMLTPYYERSRALRAPMAKSELDFV